MSEAANNIIDKPVSRLPSSNDPSSEVEKTNRANAKPYMERIRQYYNRRMPVSKSHPRQTTNNPDVEVIPHKPSKNPELDEEGGGDDRETVNNPYPGVDDGFFGNGDGTNNKNPDAEDIPLVPKPPDRKHPPEGEDQPGRHFPTPSDYGPHWPNNPEDYPGIKPDVEGGFPEPLPDINVYQHKKTLAQGMMDLALFSANANQLRYVLESYDRHPYYYPSLILIGLSIAFQVAVGIGLISNAHYNVKDDREICIANRLNNYTVLGIFLVTVINVFISAFGVANVSPSNVTP